MEPDAPGRLIAGRYRLGTVVGRGGMGIVWQARDGLLGRDVAVKELTWPAHFSAREQEAARRRAVREARAVARLSHRNVIQVFDILEEDSCPWIVMELLPARSLRELVHQEGPLSPAQAAGLGLEILAALRAAHALGIVHRDVKPANILMAPGRAVLIDFGIAQSAQTSGGATTASMLIGSPAYIAPERARGGPSGPPADLWGLGASLYAAVEGTGPFEREGGALPALTAVVADEPEPAPHAGPLLWPVISALLDKDPDRRLDAAGAERMLRLAAEPPTPEGTASRRRRPKPAHAALAGTAVLVTAALSVTAGMLGRPGLAPHQTGAAAIPSAASPSAAARPGARAVSTPPAEVGTRRPAVTPPGVPAGTHLTSRTSPTPALPAAGPPGSAGKPQPGNPVPHGHQPPPKPGKGQGKGKGKEKAGKHAQ
jgi:eukaryotic-like serine/threonine-protein kinase